MKESDKIRQLFTSDFDRIEKIAFTFLKKHTINPENIRRLFCKMINWPLEMFKLTDETFEAAMYTCMNEIFKSNMLEEMISAFIRYLNELYDIRAQKKKYSREISGVINFINNHFTEDITLNDAAQKVNVSPGYLCSLFKKELDLSFTDYLLFVRINKAKKLLLTSYMKLYEISENIGFTDYSYFSRVFKKFTGMRPQNYREKMGIAETGGDAYEAD